MDMMREDVTVSVYKLRLSPDEMIDIYNAMDFYLRGHVLEEDEAFRSRLGLYLGKMSKYVDREEGG